MTNKKQTVGDDGTEQERQRRSRSRQPGSIQEYLTSQGKRWRFQIYVVIDPEYPELGQKRVTRSGFTDTAEASAELQKALKKKSQSEKFLGKVPVISVYADSWVAGLKLEASTIQGYKKIIRNHITPQLGDIRLDKLTATRIARATTATSKPRAGGTSPASESRSRPTPCTRCTSCWARCSTRPSRTACSRSTRRRRSAQSTPSEQPDTRSSPRDKNLDW
ncbi:MAG: hypothetical protein V4531_01655 [Actinomycetota bacterium]